MAFRDHFSAQSSLYSASRPTYPESLIAFVASLAPSRRVAWDCATGSGQAAVALAQYFDRVVATDASARQIDNARPHDRVEYRVATAEASGLADGSADLVTVAQALHWLDLERFYSEVRRVLVAGGVIAVWTYERAEIDGGPLERSVRRFDRETMSAYWPADRHGVGEAYRGFAFPFEEIAAPVFTMEHRWTLTELTAYVRSWSAVVRYRAAYEDDPVDQLEAELQLHWGDVREPRRIRWPLTLRVGRVGDTIEA